MPSDEQRPRNLSAPQSIPLQDLARPPDSGNGNRPGDRRRAEASGRARALFGERSGQAGRVDTAGRHGTAWAGSSGNPAMRNGPSIPHITTPRNAHQPSYYDEDELSPVNVGDFQNAMGSVGLSFDAAGSYADITPSATGSGQPYLGHNIESGAPSPPSPLSGGTGYEHEGYFPAVDDRVVDDMAPLTDSRYLQPISGSSLPPAPGQNHARNPSSHFPGRLLGDDLGAAESGMGHPGGQHSLHRLSSISASNMQRSLSASASPLTSAGDMIRKMSQRVVNLSSEPDVVENTMRRHPSTRMATLDAPPSFPAMTEYAHDEPSAAQQPIPLEKLQAQANIRKTSRHKWQQQTNPLRGKSLGIFSPDNKLRLWLCEVLVHPLTEPCILILILLQTVLLAVDAAPYLAYGTRQPGWTWVGTEIAMLALFIIYTLETVAKIIVSGLIKNPDEYSAFGPGLSFQQSLNRNLRSIFGGPRKTNDKTQGASVPEVQVSILRSFTSIQNQQEEKGHGRQAQRVRLARRAFLRHSFNRLDFIAVISFWIAFVLVMFGIEYQRHIYVFQMLSCLRIVRLLGLTNGTSVILRSLKKAAPLLVNVAFLISFFWLLFAVVGVQSFKSSFRRTCVWLGDTNAALFVNPNTNFSTRQTLVAGGYDQNNAFAGQVQFCGGHLHPVNGTPEPYYNGDYVLTGAPKGYWCPQASLCIEGDNIYNNTVSFDNVIQSLELVFVIMSSNTFSDLLYYTTNSDSLSGAVFFALGIVIMSLWLINLLVAVITSSFQVIREESKTSAFTTDDQPLIMEEENPVKKKTPLKRVYDKTYWIWIITIVVSLLVQSVRTSTSSTEQLDVISTTETIITIILLVEIFLRFITDWRNFHRSKRNWVDLALAVITTIIQIPIIRYSGQPYLALTIFQILRIYRVVLAIPLVRNLVVVVLGNVSGILNLIIFVFLVTFLGAIFAVQLLRGEIPQYDQQSGNYIRIPFSDIYNSFLGMYQIFSSENWTAVMYEATAYETFWDTAWISALFFILWFIFANFIILNMFIAVIQENFDVTEDEKRLHQVKAFLQQKEISGSTHSNLSLSAIFRFGRESNRHKDPIDYGPATIEMFKDTVVRDFLDEQMEAMDDREAETDEIAAAQIEQLRAGIVSRMWNKFKSWVWGGEPNPFYSGLMFSRPYEELDPRMMAKEIASAAEQKKQAQRQYLRTHPNYNVSLFLFKPNNPIRRFCQQMVGPGRGSKRIEGVDPTKVRWYTFSFFIYACIVAMVLLACIATPLYQKGYFEEHGGFQITNWFVWTDMAFAAVFTIEAIIKIIADGFFWTPNAYFRGSWGFIDGIVLLTLWISVASSLFNVRDVSRAVGAFKALRALRLLNVSDSARDTFHSVIVIGGWKVLGAAFVSLSLLIPFAIYGLNLFSGQLLKCNDTNGPIENLNQCIGEYGSSPYNWTVLAPRQVANPYYNFDNFGNSLFILFQIVSQEGWVDVMWSAISAKGVGLQPENGAIPGNAIFFVAFNLLGAVFVLNLFVSVFMRNYTEQTGVAFLTAEQRSWLELRKLLRQISPSKRPSNQPHQKWKNKCYRIAVSKHGKWQKLITVILLLHLVLLVVEYYPDDDTWETIRNILFTVFIALYITNILIRIIGLTWKRFRRSSWDLYSLMSVGGTVVLTVLDFAYNGNDPVVRQLQKLFLVSIALLLIPRNNQLDQLFKTAAASFTAIANLLLTWFVLFLVWAIAMTQTLGLTRFGSQGQANLNFRTVPKALILLFRMSSGEGWNQIMEDFANATPPNCVEDDNFFNSDCGSAAWARVLFVLWNILSMYIFVSLFVSLIFESFSYVYQRSSGLSVLSREEIRRFKQAWATFDPDGTGYISKEAFPRLLGELSGVFAMRIYDGEHSVRQILEDCQVDTRGGEPPPGVVHGVDLVRLNDRLRTIDVTEIRRRRQRLNIFSQEVLVSADPDRGVPFLSCLMILAHYNVISDNKSLRLEEFLRRRYRLQRVEEEVRRRVVIGFFDTLFWSRQFRRRKDLRNSARMVDVPQFAVPEIFVDDGEGQTPRVEVFPDDEPPSPMTLTPERRPSPPGLGVSRVSPNTPQHADGMRGRAFSFNTSPGLSVPSPDGSPGLRPRRPSDFWNVDPFSMGDGSPEISPERRGSEGSSRDRSASLDPSTAQRSGHRKQQSSVASQQSMTAMEAFDNSAWGESIRRSFTVRQPSSRGRGRQRNASDL